MLLIGSIEIKTPLHLSEQHNSYYLMISIRGLTEDVYRYGLPHVWNTAVKQVPLSVKIKHDEKYLKNYST